MKNKTILILTLAIIMMMVGAVSAQVIDPSYHSAVLNGTTLTLTAKVHNLAKDPPNVARVYRDDAIPAVDQRNEANDYGASTMDASAVPGYMFFEMRIGNDLVISYFPDAQKKDVDNYIQNPVTYNSQTNEWVADFALDAGTIQRINDAKGKGVSVVVRFNPAIIYQGHIYWPWLMVSDPSQMYTANL